MKKVFMLSIVLISCICLAACASSDSQQAPRKISDVIPYDDADAEIYSFIETVDGRSVTLLYPEDRAAEMVELLDSIELKSLPVYEDLHAAMDMTGLQLALKIQNDEEMYFITVAGVDDIILSLCLSAAPTYAWNLNDNPELVRELREIDSKVHEYSHDGSGFMDVSKDMEGATVIHHFNKADSLYLADIMDAALEAGVSVDGELPAGDFAVMMELDGQTWYLDAEQRIAGKADGENITAVEMDDLYFLTVMRKLSTKLFSDERIAAEVKASWDAAKLAEQLGKETPYTKLYRYMQTSLGQWQEEEKSISTAGATWTLMEAAAWYAEKEALLPDRDTLDKEAEAEALSSLVLYNKACDQFGIAADEWIAANREAQVDSLILAAVYTSAGMDAEEINDLMMSIQEEYLDSEAYAKIKPQFERSMELLKSGGVLTAEQLLKEDIFTE